MVPMETVAGNKTPSFWERTSLGYRGVNLSRNIIYIRIMKETNDE
jgi:hypothetical protein